MAKEKNLEARLINGATYGINTDNGYKTFVKGRWTPIKSKQEYDVLAKSGAFEIREMGKGGKGVPEWNDGEEAGEEQAADTAAGAGEESAPEDKPKKKGKKK